MKANARQILDTAIMDIPEYARGDQELWTPPLVKDVLVDAFRLLRRTAGRVGPGGLKAYWPEFQNNPEDWADADKHAREAERRPSAYRTRMTVTRMEMVLIGWRDEDGLEHAPWVAGPLLLVPDLRDKLLQWVQAELRGESTVDLCQRKKWSRATFKRHRDRAAGMIAQRLNMLGIEPWR